MLRVTIELVPYGDEEEAQRIATMLIANDGTGNSKFGNYAYAYNYSDRPGEPESGTVTRYARADGAWKLVKKILNDKFSSNNDVADYLVKTLKDYEEED
jgi:hypothetical protein